MASPPTVDEERVAIERSEARARPSLVAIARMLLGFGVLSLLTSLWFGRVGDPLMKAKVLYRGSNLAGPIEIAEDDTTLNIELHGGLVADNTWATVRCELLDAHGETLFAFRELVWHEEGRDDEGSWVEWDVTFDLDVTLAEGSYSLALFIEEAPGTAPRKGRYDEGDIQVQVATVNGSHVPYFMAGGLALIAAALLWVGSRFVSGPKRRSLERVVLVGLAGLYVALFFLAAAGYGYAGYGGADHGPSFWDWNAVPTEHGPGAAKGRYPAGLDTLRFDDGSVYAGETKDGRAHGTGRRIEASGTRIFGQFRDGQPNGKVMVEYGEGSKLSTYEGTMRDGLWSGEGTLWLRNGDQYVGELLAGAKHGAGTYTFADGRQQAGRWQDDEYLGP